MKRREFISLLGGAAAARPVGTCAQPSGKTYRIGFLGVTSHAEYRRQVDAIRTGLRQRVSLLWQRTHYLGTVEAPDERAGLHPRTTSLINPDNPNAEDSH
jgi:hypothetical protein